MKHTALLLLTSLLCFTACSNIDEADRLVYVEPAVVVDTTKTLLPMDSLYDAPADTVARRVLIEDHTGQKCPNCPDAARMIHEFEQTYGDLIVPVAIHSQMQGIMEPEGLGNELGNTYYNYWRMEYKPAGMVNRLDGGDGKVLDKTIWPFALNYALTMPTPLDIRIKARYAAGDDSKADVDVKVVGTREGQSAAGKLQVWITEDGIIAEQDDMGTTVSDYVHDHVLRATVNGTWGEDVSISGKDDQKEFHYPVTLKPEWQKANIAIVAFVYNDNEVVQVTRQVIVRSDD